MDIYSYKRGVGFVRAKKINSRSENWVDLVNPNENELKEISKKLNIPLFLLKREKRPHRPKFENFKKFVAFNFKKVKFNKEITAQHVTFIFAEKYLITIHTGLSELSELKKKVDKKDFEVRHVTDSDYLLYLMLEDLIESFFPILEKIDTKIERLQRVVFDEVGQKVLEEIFALRQIVFELHKILAAEREVLLFLHEGVPGIKDKNVMYFKDLYNHLLQITDEEEIAREVLGNTAETYVSVTNNRIQDATKVLTVIATILLPMTVIVGIYGMNLSFPEAQISGFYYIIWGVLALSGLISYLYFKRKGWV